MKLIYQGAEAKLWLLQADETSSPGDSRCPSGDRLVVVKDRVTKGYRLPELDSRLRTSRTRSEVSLLSVARRAGIPAPAVLSSSGSSETSRTECRDERSPLATTRPGDSIIEMEFIQGDKLRDCLSESNAPGFAAKLSSLVNTLHDSNIIHSDLTTSNILVAHGKLYLIDFGLSFISAKVEDKAVDLRLFKQSILSSHPALFHAVWPVVESGYGNREVIKRLSRIEKRGRYAKRGE